jgi:hypothetical protein
MKIRFFNIVWDTDGQDVDLPTEATLEVDEDTQLETEGADCLSDEFGWCVLSFDFETQFTL